MKDGWSWWHFTRLNRFHTFWETGNLGNFSLAYDMHLILCCLNHFEDKSFKLFFSFFFLFLLGVKIVSNKLVTLDTLGWGYVFSFGHMSIFQCICIEHKLCFFFFFFNVREFWKSNYRITCSLYFKYPCQISFQSNIIYYKIN